MGANRPCGIPISLVPIFHLSTTDIHSGISQTKLVILHNDQLPSASVLTGNVTVWMKSDTKMKGPMEKPEMEMTGNWKYMETSQTASVTRQTVVNTCDS